MNMRYGKNLFIAIISLLAACDSSGGSPVTQHPAGPWGEVVIGEASGVPFVTTPGSAANAVFIDPSNATNCTRRVEGACQILHCAHFPDGTSTSPVAHAGAISVMGGDVPVEIMPRADGSYQPWSQMTGQFPFTNGQKLMVSAAGDAIPAFSSMVGVQQWATTLTMPIINPFSHEFTLMRDADLQLAWTVDVPLPMHSTVTLGLRAVLRQAPAADGSATVIECDYVLSDSKGTIPAAAMSDLHLTSGSGSTATDTAGFKAGITLRTTTSTGPYAVDLVTLIGGPDHGFGTATVQ